MIQLIPGPEPAQLITATLGGETLRIHLRWTGSWWMVDVEGLTAGAIIAPAARLLPATHDTQLVALHENAAHIEPMTEDAWREGWALYYLTQEEVDAAGI